MFLGLRSSGKTTVGKTLASQLNWDFFDIDQVLVDQEGKVLVICLQLLENLVFDS